MRSRTHAVVFVLLSLSTACSKEQKTDPAAATPAASSAAPAPSASVPAPAETAAASAEPAARADAGIIPTQVAAATHSTAKAGSPDAAPAAATACGTKPLPDCPLQAWMKANTATAMASKDFPAIATALDKIVTFAPAGYTNWASISKDGAAAARASNLDAVKAACRGCHDQYRTKFKADAVRSRPVS
jgi:hypothetical protein